MPAVNLLAVILATLSGVLIGGLWYSSVRIAKPSMAETGLMK